MMSKFPLVSIILPTFNRPHLLNEALESIASQTFKEFEVIVVNDGGEDVSDVVKRFKNSLKIFYLSHDKNKGHGATRNTSLSVAKGRYIAYLDDDDIFYPQHLETLTSFLEKDKEAVAYTDLIKVVYKKDDSSERCIGEGVAYSLDFDREYLLVENYIHIDTIMHKRDCLEKSGYFEKSWGINEDWDLLIRLAKFYEFHHIKKLTCEWRLRVGEGMTLSGQKNHIEDLRYIYKKYADIPKSEDVKEAQKLNLKEMEIKRCGLGK